MGGGERLATHSSVPFVCFSLLFSSSSCARGGRGKGKRRKVLNEARAAYRTRSIDANAGTTRARSVGWYGQNMTSLSEKRKQKIK